MERVFVGNLPPDIRIKDIDDFFRPFGKLVYVDVNNRTNPASAFVQFDSARNAFNAVRARHGYDYEGYNIQMKLMANANNDRSFEVRNQTQQRTPPPPPPMFNDYNSQNMNNMGRYNNNSNFGNSGNFGNNDFGNNYTTDNYGNNNFMNSSSSFQNSMPSQNMVQYPTSRAIMPLQNKMIEYPSTGRYGGAGSNNAIGNSNRAGGFNRAGGSGTGSNRAGGSGTVSNRSGGVATNRSGGAATNRSGGGGSNRSGAAGSNRGGAAGSNRGGAAGSNRSGVTGSSRGGVAASNRSGGGSIRGTGGGNANTYNKNNDCYADSTFEDRFTQGLSGSGRKWFNRYIRQGFTPKQSREKALEHRTLPYLREGAGKQLDIIPNNAVPNLPLPTLENIGNKIMSLFGAAGVGSFGGNNNQMMSNLSNWVGGNIQGGFSNDFNMSGPSSSNSRRGRNRMDRDEKAPSGRNILENMLTDIPTLYLQNQFANRKFSQSMGILKKLEDKESVSSLNRKDIEDKNYHTQLIKEYRIWRKKHVKKDVQKPTTSKEAKTNDDNKSESKELARYKSALRFVTQFEWRNFRSMSKKERRKYDECTHIILTYEKRMKVEKKNGRANLNSDPIENVNNGKSIKQILEEYKAKKEELLKEATPNPDDPIKRRRSGASKKRCQSLVNEGIQEEEARTLSILPREKLVILIALSRSYFKKTGININVKITEEEKTDETIKARKTKNNYRNAIKYLKKYETHDLTTLTDREKALIRICLRRKRRIDEEQGLPLDNTRFDYLLKESDLTETGEDAKNVEENLATEDTENDTTIGSDSKQEEKEENVENEENPKDVEENEDEIVISNGNQDENDQDNIDLTEEQDNENENDQVNEETEEQDDDNENVIEETDEQDNENENDQVNKETEEHENTDNEDLAEVENENDLDNENIKD